MEPTTTSCRPIVLLISLLLTLPPLFAGDAGTPQLPEIGTSANAYMTPRQEQRLGQAFMRRVRAEEKVLDDVLLEDYIETLGKRITQSRQDDSANFHYFLIDNRQINAFAGPAGHIGIYSGLILTTESESELASVIAHEISHVTQRHLLRTWEEASKLSVPQAAVLLAAAVIGAAAGGDAGFAAAIGGQAALAQHQINFTRANEEEADRIGIALLADADFEPRAMPVFFERMGRANRTAASKLPEYLRTHPVTTNRIADSMARADAYPYKQNPDELGYHLMRATLRQREFASAEEAIRYFKMTLSDGRYRSETAQQYGLALAYLHNNQAGEARQIIDKLLRQSPTQSEFLVTGARIDNALGTASRAIEGLQSALLLFPNNYPLRYTLAELLLGNKQPEKAAEQLHLLIDQRPGDPALYKLLARAAAPHGNSAKGHEYMAEHYYLSGLPEAAMLQLEIALRDFELSFYDTVRLESRLKEVRAEVDELKKHDKEKKH